MPRPPLYVLCVCVWSLGQDNHYVFIIVVALGHKEHDYVCLLCLERTPSAPSYLCVSFFGAWAKNTFIVIVNC